MFRTLPSKGNLENIEKEARVLLYDLRRGDPATIRRFYLLDSEAPTLVTRLGDAPVSNRSKIWLQELAGPEGTPDCAERQEVTGSRVWAGPFFSSRVMSGRSTKGRLARTHSPS